MNVALWIFQALLALHTATGALWKFSVSEQGIPSLRAIPHPIWLGLSVVELVAAALLIAPAFDKRLGRFVAIASGFLVVEMFGLCAVHLFSGNPEHGELVYWLVVAAICGFVTWGRLVAAPIKAA